MTLFLEILDGDQKGTRIPAREGVSIGRRQGTITIRDSKLSSLHANIQGKPDGSLWLVDMGSQNGIKAHGKRVRELKLKEDVSFTLGRTQFQVVLGLTEEAERFLKIHDPKLARDWWYWIENLAERGVKETQLKKIEIAPFQPPLKFKFIRGVQTGTEWTLGYGPRSFGSRSADLNLEDPSLKDVCFDVLPQDKGALIKAVPEQKLKLNGKWIETEFLKSGDVIEVGSTQIQVVFDDND